MRTRERSRPRPPAPAAPLTHVHEQDSDLADLDLLHGASRELAEGAHLDALGTLAGLEQLGEGV